MNLLHVKTEDNKHTELEDTIISTMFFYHVCIDCANLGVPHALVQLLHPNSPKSKGEINDSGKVKVAFAKGTWSFKPDTLIPLEMQLGAFVRSSNAKFQKSHLV